MIGSKDRTRRHYETAVGTQERSGTDRLNVRPNQVETTGQADADAPSASPKTARFEDAVLVRQVQAGELHAFTELVRKYQDRVYNTCKRVCGDAEEAADLTQEAFMKAFASIDLFRGKSAFYTWIFRIAVNLSISYQRKRRTRSTVSLDRPIGDQTDGDARVHILRDESVADPADAPEAAETHARVLTALQELDPDHRVAIVLRDIEGFDYQEIADILELPVGTVKSRIFRGRLALRERLRDPAENDVKLS
jgi:RNA polymerase sigma-70 factor (ECF subfamily)